MTSADDNDLAQRMQALEMIRYRILVPEKSSPARSLYSLLIVYLGPPLIAVAVLVLIASWFAVDRTEPMAAEATVIVKKGDRIGSHVGVRP